MPLLKTNNISIQFGGLKAVTDFNLEINEKEIVGLIGPNGSGKTTIFNMITGIYKPTQNTICFNDEDITGLRPYKISLKGISRTFQNIRLLKPLSVTDNILVASHKSLKSNVVSSTIKTPSYRKQENKFREYAYKLLDFVGLLELKNEKAGSLPYGSQRMLEIARALAGKPKLLLLDEPAAGMNPNETSVLIDLIKDIRDKFNITIFIIEHDMNVIMKICDRIVAINHGIKIASGNPEEIQKNQKVIEAYLGTTQNVTN